MALFLMSTEPGNFFATARFIRYGVMRLAQRMRVERADDALSPSKLILLGWLMRKGPLTPGELAALERVRPQSLTRTLASLEEEGLISRRTGESDRRQSVVAITEQGHAAFSQDMRQRDIWLATVMTQRLSPTEREILRLAVQLMERLAAPDPEPTQVETP
jgi:DNA-binding MarR family transcriptional regulator